MAGKNAGEYAYLLGLVVAVLAGIAVAAQAIGSVAGWVSLLLVILGVVVGLMNISEKESNAFLVASIALVAVGSFHVFDALNAVSGTLATLLNQIVLNIAVFAAPAAIITAVKSVHVMASKK
jgi:hypothetical protein